jgi:hypothetical protein
MAAREAQPETAPQRPDAPGRIYEPIMKVDAAGIRPQPPDAPPHRLPPTAESHPGGWYLDGWPLRAVLPYGLGARRSARQGYGVTVIVACIEGWMVQVMAYVPAVGKTMDLLSPGENDTPAALANSLGAPAAAENAPLCPVTKW